MNNIVIVTLLICSIGTAETYEYSNKLKLEAPNYKTAAKKCYNILTKNVYPGEELGLAIIDLCVNPIKGSVK